VSVCGGDDEKEKVEEDEEEHGGGGGGSLGARFASSCTKHRFAARCHAALASAAAIHKFNLSFLVLLSFLPSVC
jgi:hypothetical protein